MGLDTVELVVSFERYFDFEVPDSVSETFITVGDVAAWFSQQLGVAGQRQSTVRTMIAEQLVNELPPGTTEATPLKQLLLDALVLKTFRYALRDHYSLLLPSLSPPLVSPPTPSLWERLTGHQLPKAPHWYTQTLAELVDWVIAINYEKLLIFPLSQYEVEQAVIGMTSDKSGMPVEEIQLRSSFTNDLGMD